MSNHNILPWAMTTKANIQLLGWWLVLFAYVVLVGLWDLVLLNCHRPELPSGEQQSRKGPSDLFISDITILHSGAGAWSKQRTEQQRQASTSTFTAALTFTQPSSSLVTGATLWQLEPNGDDGSRVVCVWWALDVFQWEIVNVRRRQRHSTTLVKCDNQSEKLLLQLSQVINTIYLIYLFVKW